MTSGIFTDSTCGANCWYARELDCRCFCGGSNHGIMLQEGNEQPERTCRIKGKMYRLAAVTEKYSEAQNLAYGFNREKREAGDPYWYRYEAQVRTAQNQRWPELEPFANNRHRPYIVWFPVEETK